MTSRYAFTYRTKLVTDVINIHKKNDLFRSCELLSSLFVCHHSHLHNFKHFIFFFETTMLAKFKLVRNVHWMDLYKVYVFCCSWKCIKVTRVLTVDNWQIKNIRWHKTFHFNDYDWMKTLYIYMMIRLTNYMWCLEVLTSDLIVNWLCDVYRKWWWGKQCWHI